MLWGFLFVFGLWLMAYGLWLMAYGLWLMAKLKSLKLQLRKAENIFFKFPARKELCS